MLALSGSADGSGTVNLTGSGTLGVAGQADGTGSVALTGSGALSTAGSSGAGSASLAVAATSFAESASATSLACPVPTGTAAGDLLVALVVGPTNVATTATVTGWTLDKSQGGADSAANDGQTTYYRVATGSEPASYTFTSTGTANRMSVLMARVTGADTTTPLDVATVSSSGAAATTYTAPSITTTTAGAMLLHWVSVNASSTNAMTITPPSGLTQKALTDGSVAAGRKAGLWSEPRPTAGATGTRAWASTTAIQFAGTTMAIRPASTGGGTVTPTLGHRIVGIPTTTTVEIGVRVTNASSVRLKVGTDAGVTSGVVFGAAATPDADGYATLTATGLSAGTRYYYRVAMTPAGGGTEVLDPSATVGTFATAPSGPASFAFNFGSCTNAADSVALAAIAARGDDLFLHLGDLYYDDGTGTSAANILAHQQAKVEATNHQAVMAFTPTAYTPSDHDGMNNNSAAGDDPTAWANFNTVYRKVWPASGIPATSGVYRTFVWGRVRFIQLDDRSFHSPIAATDNASKTALGSVQKQWLKDTITAATEPVIVLMSSAPWIGSATAGDDGWSGATTERTELANFFAASGKPIVLLHGDQHALAADDGTNAPGGVTVFAAAPFDNFSSHKGGPFSAGTYPTTDNTQVRQYGRVVVTDTGSSISLAFTGYSSDNTARISLTKTVSPTGSGTVALTGSGTLSTAGSSGTGTGAGTVALTGSGTLSTAGSFGNGATGSGTVALTGTSTLAVTGTGTTAPVVVTPPPRGIDWSAFARDGGYGLSLALPILDLSGVLRHMGLDKAVLTTPYSLSAWNALQPSYGIELYRSGRQMFGGPITSRTLTWDGETGVATIKVEAVGDQIVLADRLAMPDPLRAADDQTVNDHWTFTGTASAAMCQLISDQAGATCAASRKVTGLTVGADPNAGISRTWTGLFDNVLDLLATMSASSGADLGLRMTSATGVLTATVVVPRNLSGTVTFSADLSNVGSTTFTENAPAVTSALVAGQGDLHLRTRKLTATTDPGSTRWGRQVWSYVDRRDTSDLTELANAGTDALAKGAGTVSLTLTLLDSDAATYGKDWDLGDKVTVYVGLPGESKVAQVDDVVREIAFTVSADGTERISPAIGSVDARSFLPTPAQRTTASLVERVAALIKNK
jgi:phosphodiesterase/alkaline phosphatase D-like protein